MERARSAVSSDAEDFVRFCYRRRRVGWPELYDEMCHVATRGAFRGMGHAELAEVGIGFSLFDTSRLADLVTRVVREEQAERARLRAGIRIVRSDDNVTRDTVHDRSSGSNGAPDEAAVAPLALAVPAGA